MRGGSLSARTDAELTAALRRARALWEDLLRLMIAKDRALLRHVDTADLERLMEVRGVELAREEALIHRLEGTPAPTVDEAAHGWRAAGWAGAQPRPGTG